MCINSDPFYYLYILIFLNLSKAYSIAKCVINGVINFGEVWFCCGTYYLSYFLHLCSFFFEAILFWNRPISLKSLPTTMPETFGFKCFCLPPTGPWMSYQCPWRDTSNSQITCSLSWFKYLFLPFIPHVYFPSPSNQ